MQLQVRRHEVSGLHAGAHRTFVRPHADIVELVARDLGEAERLLSRELESVESAVTEIGRYLAASGGKRLRPLLTALGARAAGNRRDVARLACVGELVHLGSLLHDDVVDESAERRGRPAAHLVYGNAGVILTGDFCVSRGMSIAAEDGGLRAVTELARAVAAMSEGEVRQLQNAGDLTLPVAAYYDTIDKKSASLVAWCAAAGAWAAGEDGAAAALAAYGRAVGTAFQIADDVLDYVGKRSVTGKQRGRDLAQRKITLPLLLAIERIPDLAARLEAGPPEDDQLEGLLEEVRGCGAVSESLAVARGHVQSAVEALAPLPDTPERDALVALAWYLSERSA